DSRTPGARLADTQGATRGHPGRDSRGRGVRLSSVTASGCHGVRATDRGWMSSRTVNAPTRATAARLDRVDAAKGISILLVVAHHVVWYMRHAGLAPAPVVMADEAFASLRMPLFFLASGLVAAGPLAAPWRVVLHKRVAFFLYLYAIWTIIRFAFFATLVPPEVDPDGSADPVAFALALLLPGPSMWFLYALAVFAVLTKLARPLPVWVQLGAPGALSALVGAGLVDFGDTRWTYLARFL